MPLIRFDIIEGRTDAEISAMLDAAHLAVVDAFEVPDSDRYQVVTEHKADRMIAMDTGLGIERTRQLTLVSVTTRARSDASKQRFYTLLCERLEQNCGIGRNDVIVSITGNSDADWSFGNGVAQYITGEL
jgi:hypothetical protein